MCGGLCQPPGTPRNLDSLNGSWGAVLSSVTGGAAVRTRGRWESFSLVLCPCELLGEGGALEHGVLQRSQPGENPRVCSDALLLGSHGVAPRGNSGRVSSGQTPTPNTHTLSSSLPPFVTWPLRQFRMGFRPTFSLPPPGRAIMWDFIQVWLSQSISNTIPGCAPDLVRERGGCWEQGKWGLRAEEGWPVGWSEGVIGSEGRMGGRRR